MDGKTARLPKINDAVTIVSMVLPRPPNQCELLKSGLTLILFEAEFGPRLSNEVSRLCAAPSWDFLLILAIKPDFGKRCAKDCSRRMKSEA